LLFVVFMLVSSFRSFVPHYNKRGGQNTGLQGDFLKINKIVLVHNLLVQKYLRFGPLGAF